MTSRSSEAQSRQKRVVVLDAPFVFLFSMSMPNVGIGDTCFLCPLERRSRVANNRGEGDRWPECSWCPLQDNRKHHPITFEVKYLLFTRPPLPLDIAGRSRVYGVANEGRQTRVEVWAIHKTNNMKHLHTDIFLPPPPLPCTKSSI